MLTTADRFFLTLCDPESSGPPPDCRRPASLPAPPEMCRRAVFHGVHNLLQANLQHGGWRTMTGNWGQTLLEQLEPWVVADKARGLALRAQGERVLHALGSAGISALLLKGADFADHLYPRPGLRSFSDIDLLVRPADFSAAQEVLLALGCRQTAEGPLKHAADSYGEVCFTAGIAGLQLRMELHWNLVNSPSLQKAVSVTLDDLLDDQGQFGHEGRLLLAAVHAGTGHQFDRLKFLFDLRQIFRRLDSGGDSSWLAHRMAATGSRKVVSTACWLTENLLQCECARHVRLRLDLPAPPIPWRWLLGPSLVVRSHRPWLTDALRRNLFREYLKGKLGGTCRKKLASCHGRSPS